ncbi:hypothetical protein U0070_017957, partial [Myodes glareolus]
GPSVSLASEYRQTIVSIMTKVPILYERTLGVKEYHIYKDRISYTWCKYITLEPEFSNSYIDKSHAGRYKCHYQTKAESSGYSEPLELVVTGEETFRASFLGYTLRCIPLLQPSLEEYCDCTVSPTQSCDILMRVHDSSVCLKEGLSKMPSLLTHQGHILDFGKSLTLQCCFDITYDRFALYKVGSVNLKHHCDQCTQSVLYLASFTLDLYKFYGTNNLFSEWSTSSDTLDILIT